MSDKDRRSMYTYTIERGLLYDGRRVPRVLNLEYPNSIHQTVIDILCHFFRDENEPERRAYALLKRSPGVLVTRFAHLETCLVSDEELVEMVTTILCEWKERVSGKTDLVYLDGQRRDTLRLQ
jgi:hypothetical protein